ncbi:MAG: zinc-regulated TonB-dependent outer membrane receptor [Kofleriaceae bacterium]|nr:zinc-regulated TonB-dependent outer membrane receptor [Kofleriaceae bacterium]
MALVAVAAPLTAHAQPTPAPAPPPAPAAAAAPADDATAPADDAAPPPGDAPEDAAAPDGDAADDDEDLSDIEAALADDAAAAEDARPAPPQGGLAGAAAALNPDLSFIADVAAAWFWGDDPMQTGDHDPQVNGFTLQQVEMSIAKSVDPYFRFDANIVFKDDGAEVEEAYATTLAMPHALQVRAGKFLTRFGRLNATHPHTWDFVDQPLAFGRVFGGEGNRGAGAELSWLTPLPWYTEVLVSVTDPHGEGTARSFLGASDRALDTPLDVQTTAAAHQFFDLNDDWSLLWGLSWATAPNPSGDATRTHVVGADLYVKWRPITRASFQQVALQTEWLLRRRQQPAGTITDLDTYAQLTWRFAQRWGVGGRWEYGGAPAFTGATVVDDLDPDWTEARQRATAQLTFWPTEFSRLRAQASVDRPAWRDPVWATFLSMEFAVGAHGAHKF